MGLDNHDANIRLDLYLGVNGVLRSYFIPTFLYFRK
jgi:hypothetical protein